MVAYILQKLVGLNKHKRAKIELFLNKNGQWVDFEKMEGIFAKGNTTIGDDGIIADVTDTWQRGIGGFTDEMMDHIGEPGLRVHGGPFTGDELGM